MFFQEKTLDRDLDILAEKINSMGLRQPVEFLLESHHPLFNLISHLTLLVEPVMIPFFNISRMGGVLSFLNKEDGRREFLSKLRDS